MKKQKKSELRPDTVDSATLHIGIELELVAPGDDDGETEHDDDDCYQSRRENMGSMSTMEILTGYVGLSRDDARSVESYFDSSQWVDDYMDNDECQGDCGYESSRSNGNDTRMELQRKLKNLTGNVSFKVVSDSSISADDGVDAEVCWNYFASRETIADNAKILKLLKDEGCDFNRSCGLHINLNNYLNVPVVKIETAKLDFLFNFVAASRRAQNYCNNFGMHNEKYSMIFNQGDRLEFRFFSPTLEAEKLNHYVSLANVVYRRLAGKNAKLSKKSMKYFFEKMTGVNGVSIEIANDSLKKLNSLKSAKDFKSINDEARAESEANRGAANEIEYGISAIREALSLNPYREATADALRILYNESDRLCRLADQHDLILLYRTVAHLRVEINERLNLAEREMAVS